MTTTSKLLAFTAAALIGGAAATPMHSHATESSMNSRQKPNKGVFNQQEDVALEYGEPNYFDKEEIRAYRQEMRNTRKTRQYRSGRKELYKGD